MKSIIIILLILSTYSNINSQNYYSTNIQTVSFVYDADMRENIGDSISEKVLSIFKKSDLNSDGKISVGELQAFQNWLMANFKYKDNETALHPDEFIKQRGGDCEDFAIMTCCMLNYHGVVAFVAGFGKVTKNKHALCLVQVTADTAPGYLFYTLQGWGIPHGYYIPVDYDNVGGLSAIDRRWKIAKIRIPKNLYGLLI